MRSYLASAGAERQPGVTVIRLGIRTALAVVLLGIVAGSGVGIGSASADTTAVTCNPATGGGGFSDSHCVNKVTDGATFIHQGFPENTSSPITIVNAGMAATIKSNIGGLEISVACTTASGSGILNTQGGAEMYSFGTAGITFSGCTVENTVGCTVSGGTVTTKPLVFTTKGQGMGVKFAPETPSVLAEIVIDGCPAPITGLNGTWPLTGSVVLTPHGATLTSEHTETTIQGTLIWFGTHKAGLASSLTLKGPSGAGVAFTT
jgi:hypothetical protein